MSSQGIKDVYTRDLKRVVMMATAQDLVVQYLFKVGVTILTVLNGYPSDPTVLIVVGLILGLLLAQGLYRVYIVLTVRQASVKGMTNALSRVKQDREAAIPAPAGTAEGVEDIVDALEQPLILDGIQAASYDHDIADGLRRDVSID